MNFDFKVARPKGMYNNISAQLKYILAEQDNMSRLCVVSCDRDEQNFRES